MNPGPLATYGTFGLHVLLTPSGKYKFVGSVPVSLLIESVNKWGQKEHKSPLFDTEQEAIQYFNDHKPITL